MDQRTAGILFAITTGLCWALLALALRYALHFASSGTIAWVRLVVAFVCLVGFYAWKDPKRLRLLWTARPLVVVAGLGLALNYIAFMRGIEFTGANNAQIMIQLGPLSLVLVGIIIFRERPTRLQTIGLVVASMGFALFFWDQILATLADSSRFFTGDIWLLLAAAGWTLFASLQKGLKAQWSAQQFNMVIYGICTLALLPVANFHEMPQWDFGVWVLMIGCGLNTLVAYGCFSEALQRIPASHVSVILAANPLVTIFLVTWLGSIGVSWVAYEPIAWRGYLGAAFVVMGVILTVWKKPLRRTARPD